MKYIPFAVSAIIVLFGYLMHLKLKKRDGTSGAGKSIFTQRLLTRIGMMICIFGIWLAVGSAITLVFGTHVEEEFTVSIFSPRMDFSILGYHPSETMVVGWAVIAVLSIGAVISRIFFIPKLSNEPGRFQNAVEMIVELIESYASERTTDLGRPMYGYVFTIGMMLIGNAVAELLGFRSPSSDLTFTLALSIYAFLMANWYGIRKLSLTGRLKSFLKPTPLLLPIRIITDLANPLSMACRLFGNTLSGMIVMNLIYSVLGNFAAGIPSIVGLYFNVFTALIQTVIFITLALSNINEATTAPEI